MRGPQVLVHVSIYQGSILGTFVDPQPFGGLSSSFPEFRFGRWPAESLDFFLPVQAPVFVQTSGWGFQRKSVGHAGSVWGSQKNYMAQKTGIPKWVALVSGNMDQHLRFAPPV